MTVRVGLVGAGWVGQARHVPAFRSHPEVELVCLYDRTLARAEGAAKSLEIERWTDEIEEFLDSDLDIVSIATPPWTHAELAHAAFERGAHVFTEKPMAMTSAEAEGMVASARAADRLLCVSHNFKFSRAAQQASQFLGSEPEPMYALGLQLSSLGRRLPSWYQELPGGLLFDEIPHLIYLLQHFLGSLEVEFVRSSSGGGAGEARTVEVLVAGERAPGQISMVFDAPVSEWQVLVTDRRGIVMLDLFRDIAIRLGPDGEHKAADIMRTSARGVAHHAAGFLSSGFRYLSGRLLWGHDELIRRFVEATLQRGPMPVQTDEALGVVRVSDHIVDVLRTGGTSR